MISIIFELTLFVSVPFTFTAFSIAYSFLYLFTFTVYVYFTFSSADKVFSHLIVLSFTFNSSVSSCVFSGIVASTLISAGISAVFSIETVYVNVSFLLTSALSTVNAAFKIGVLTISVSFPSTTAFADIIPSVAITFTVNLIVFSLSISIFQSIFPFSSVPSSLILPSTNSVPSGIIADAFICFKESLFSLFILIS